MIRDALDWLGLIVTGLFLIGLPGTLTLALDLVHWLNGLLR